MGEFLETAVEQIFFFSLLTFTEIAFETPKCFSLFMLAQGVKGERTAWLYQSVSKIEALFVANMNSAQLLTKVRLSKGEY